ncbi:hypothetical protein DAETH_38560 (plasmid) [Deinococcus aetherius]|uniref:Uncharacterized protein n=1 Tax=Deinococcus aetherius TaxID=200252 RepID=A0ABN6RKM6_9DEIO|nr:hypothetical protein DAETH_38560 [Deinococcus aetherius]
MQGGGLSLRDDLHPRVEGGCRRAQVGQDPVPHEGLGLKPQVGDDRVPRIARHPGEVLGRATRRAEQAQGDVEILAEAGDGSVPLGGWSLP